MVQASSSGRFTPLFYIYVPALFFSNSAAMYFATSTVFVSIMPF
jgi:hypothetical protein